MKRNSRVAAPTATSRHGRARNCFLLAAAAVTTLTASVSWAAPAGAAASITATYDPETCDLTIQGTGFLADAGFPNATTLAVAAVDSRDPVQSGYNPWFLTEIPATDVAQDGSFSFEIPSMVEFVADAPPLISVFAPDVDGGPEIAVTAPASPCTAQQVFLAAPGIVIGTSASAYGSTGELVLPVWGTVDGYACRFNAAVEPNANTMLAISEDHAAGACVMPPGHSLIGASGSLQWVSFPPGRPRGYRASLLTPVDVSGIACADGTCLVLAGSTASTTTTTTTAPTTTSTSTSTTTTAVVTTTTAAPGGVVKPRFTG